MVHARGSLDVTGDRHDLDSRSLLRSRDTVLFRASRECLRVDCSGIPMKHRDSRAARRRRQSDCDCGMIHIVSRNRAPPAADRTTTVALWDSGFSPRSSNIVLDPVPRLTFLGLYPVVTMFESEEPGWVPRASRVDSSLGVNGLQEWVATTKNQPTGRSA